MISKNALENKLKFNPDTETFGQIVTRIIDNLNLNEAEKTPLRTFFNNEMRNIIAHDDWYHDENRKFCYMKSGKEIKLEWADVYADVLTLNVTIGAFATIYYSDFALTLKKTS